MARSSSTVPFLQGDLTPHQTDLMDLRNDHAGDEMMRARGSILRYVRNLPAGTLLDVEAMAEDLGHRHPFHGKDVGFFQEALDSLEEDGWVEGEGDDLELHRVARVTREYLSRAARRCSRRRTS